MKIKKIISLIIVLCIMMSTISIGIFFASAAEVDDTTEKLAANLDEISNTTGENWDDFVWWNVLNTNFSYQITSEDFSNYKMLLENYYIDSANYFYFPTNIIATQSVEGGKLIALLCLSGYSPEKIEYDELGMDGIEQFYHFYRSYWYTLFTFYEDSAGNKKVVNATQIDPEKLKTIEKNTQGVNDSWTITEPKNEFSNYYTAAHESAIKEYKDINLEGLAYIGVENKGYFRTGNYRILCAGTVNSKTNLYIVDIYEDEGEKNNDDDNKAEIKNISLFDLSEYAGFKEGEEPNPNATDDTKPNNTGSDNNNSNNNNSNNNNNNSNIDSTANDSAGKSYNNTNNANGSIATGQSNVAITIVLVLIVIIPAVLFLLRKRTDY